MSERTSNNGQTVISGCYTSQQAADLLGVSTHQIAQLIHSGELDAARTAGDAFLLDAASVTHYARVRRGRGRPFSRNIAWAALWFLSGLETNWLTYQQNRRLLIRLRDIRAEELIWLVRKRSRLLRLRIDQSFLNSARGLIVGSGASSAMMSDLGLTLVTDRLEGYLAEQELDSFLKATYATSDGEANVLLWVVSNDVPDDIMSRTEMPSGVVAVDLASSAVERERSAGLRLLGELLHEQKS